MLCPTSNRRFVPLSDSCTAAKHLLRSPRRHAREMLGISGADREQRFRAPEIGTLAFPHFCGVTHAHFVVASGNPFASNSSRCCEQNIHLAAERLEF